MNKEKAKLLAAALAAGQAPSECNDPEISALLEAGDKIKSSVSKDLAPTVDFQDRLRMEILARRQAKTFSMKDKIAKIWEAWFSRFNVRRLAPALALVVILAVIITAVKFWPQSGFSPFTVETAYARDNFSVEATAGGEFGVEANTHFVIKSKTAIKDLDSLRANIKLSPATEFDLTAVNEYEFRLIPKDGLVDKVVYRLTIASAYVNDQGLTVDHLYSWAFQVKNKFKITGSLPADRTSALANTGIEINFSTENFTGFETAFNITPAVEGAFEKHRQTMVFVPKQSLNPGTLYTVTVAPSVNDLATGENLSEAYRFQFEVREEEAPATTINFADDLVEFATEQNPAFSVYARNKQAEQLAAVKVYNYQSLDAFTAALEKYYEIPSWAASARRCAEINYSGLSLAATYNLPLASNDRGNYLVLPNRLPAGFYLVEAAIGDNHSWIFVQVSDVSAYTTVINDEVLFWINDIGLDKKSPAKVSNLGTKTSASADASGVAVLKFDYQDEKTSLFLIEAAGKNLVVSVPPDYRSDGANNPDNYWSYLYTDRDLYQPTDEINFWGFVRSRSDVVATADKEVTVRLVNDSFWDIYQEPIIVVEQKAKIDSQGFFIGSLKFNNLIPRNYRVDIRLDDKELYSGRYIIVQDYIKPAYQIKVAPSAQAVFAGDSVNYEIKTSFFEGTPLVNHDLEIVHNNKSSDSPTVSDGQMAATDGNGTVNLKYTTSCSCSGDSCGDTCRDELTVKPKLSEAGEVYGSADVRVFRTRIRFDNASINRVGQENKVQIKTELFNVDLNKAEDDWNGAPAAGKVVTVKITAIEYIPRQTGTYYDFINKVSYPIYRYDQKKTALPDRSFATGADGTGSLVFDVDPKYYYEIKLLAGDQYNNITNDNLYFNASQSINDPRFDYYNLVEETPYKKSYDIDEKVKLEVKRYGTETITDAGRFLYLRLQNGLRDYQVSDSSKFSFNYAADDIPNIYVVATWFDGRTYHADNGFSAFFNQEKRKLDIAIKTDKDEYRPGDEATLNISVKDQAGRDVRARINVSAVDLALAPLGGIPESDPLSGLYRALSSGHLFSKYSHKNVLLGGGAERGGGGSGERSYFPDLALFTQVETDQSGRATVKFQLPDNITSWQMSVQGISGDLEAGVAKTQLKATLPFFVETNLSKQYLAGDEPIIKATAYGDDLVAADKIQAYLEAPALGAARVDQEAKAFRPIYFNLNRVSAGTYKLKIGAASQNNQDTVVNEISVIDSRLSERHQIVSEIKTGDKIAGAEDSWTTITLMDNNRGRYYSELLGLSHGYGARVDQKLSALIATDLMNEYFSAATEPTDADLKIYQTATGGISLLPYSDADLRISVLAAMAKPEAFDSQALAGYLYSVYNNRDANRDELALALSGLAALNEPVLISLREFSRLSDLGPLDKLYLALGARLIGDNQLAQKIYDELLAAYGEKFNAYSRLKINDKNNDDNFLATVLAAILAAGLDDDRAENFRNYVVDNRPTDILGNLEQLLYLRLMIPNIPSGKAEFSLKIANQEINKTLGRGESFQFLVGPEQLPTLEIKVISGQIAAVSDYDARADLTKQSQEVGLERSYWNKGKLSNDFQEGDIVEVRIKSRFSGTAPDGLYEITDILPSGLKLISNTYRYGLEADCGIRYPYEVSGQKVKFIVDKNWNKDPRCQKDYFSYFARISQPGKYIAESALIQSVKIADLKSFSSAGQIEIHQR
ncbi:MAG: alpha-2-macroglobulin family protein [Patescibacteria group bacterium]